MVYSADGISGTEAIASHHHLSLVLSNKRKQEYLETCSFVRSRMSLLIVRSNTLLLCGTRDKGAYILQITDMEDGGVMALLAL